MKITNVAIDNKTSIFILILIIVILGYGAYVSLPREASPDISIPFVIVSTPYFGVAPEDIETLITQPIEKEIKSIGEVKKIQSSSFEGYSVIYVEFESGYNIDDALSKVRDKVNKAEPKLPADAEKPEIMEINFSEFPILTYNISGPVGLVKLKDIAEDIKNDIEKIQGILEVKINGGMEREVKVDVDATKMVHYNVRFDDIINAIRNENQTIPGGTIDVNSSSFMVRIPGEYKEPYSIENIIIKLKDGDPIYIKDVARVHYDFKDRSTYARLEGNDAVSIDITKRVGQNIIRIANDVKKVIQEKKNILPANINISLTNDQSKEIEEQVRELENNIFSGLVLVVLVLFFFLGGRTAFFVAISIPLSMLISFFVLQSVGITLNFVVLFGLVLALGMLVDNAIVIIENIYKFLEEGHELKEAAKLGTAEVAWPVTTSTITTLAAFFPLLFWPGIVGDFMFYIPSILIITLLSSLFVALLINPVIAATFMKLENKHLERKTLWNKITYPFSRIHHFFVDEMLPKVLTLYENTLRTALGPIRTPNQKINKRNWLGVAAIIGFFFIEGSLAEFVPIYVEILISIFAGVGIIFIFINNRLKVIWGTVLSLYIITQIYGMLGHGTEFFPKVQPPVIYINLETPTGSNLETTNAIAMELEKKIIDAKFPNIENVLTVVGSSSNPFDAGGAVPNKASIIVKFIDYADREESSLETTEKIRELVSGKAGVDIKIEMQDAGPPVGQAVNIEISGEEIPVLGNIAARVRKEIESIPGIVDLKDNFDQGKPELRIEVDRQKAALYALNTGLIASNIRTAVNGTTASKYRVKDDEFDITVRLEKDQRNSLDKLKNLKIIYNNDQGKTLSVPLISVADIYIGKGPSAIRRIDLDRVITVSANAAEGYNANDVLEKAKEKLESFNLPQGYKMQFTGQSKEQEEAQAFLGRAFMIAILLIFLILVIQFNSVSQPFIIMSAVIISLVGVFIGLIVFAMPFGIIMTGIGVISLAGVVVNNNIVLIDYTNQLRKRGLTRREAIVTAGLRRFRPVTLTAITTILGLIPLSFGFGFDIYSMSFTMGGQSQEFWKSMGISVIFGLAFATILTLVIVPVIYSTLDDIPDAIKQFKTGVINRFKRLFKKRSK